MAQVGIRELEANASEIVRRVRERGEVIDITYHREVVARLVPVGQPVIPPEEIAPVLPRLSPNIGSISPDNLPTL